MQIIETDLGNGWTVQRTIIDGVITELRIFRVSHYSPNEQEIILRGEEATALINIFNQED